MVKKRPIPQAMTPSIPIIPATNIVPKEKNHFLLPNAKLALIISISVKSGLFANIIETYARGT